MSRTHEDELLEKISALKRKRNASIIAHNFQPGEVQEAADFVGGFEEMLRKAAAAGEEVILVGGVYFMAEMIAALCPGKVVLIPDQNASCPMVRMLEIRKLRETKASQPDMMVACYLKATLESIAESDLVLSYERALEHLRSAEGEVLFIPNTHLGQNLAMRAGRKLSLLGGYCPPHIKILARDVKKAMEEHPAALVLAHPECRLDVVELADKVLSSDGIARFASASREDEFIIASEVGLVHRLARENPGKKFHPASSRALCQNMKLINLDSIFWSLRDMVHRVEVPEEAASLVRRALEKALET